MDVPLRGGGADVFIFTESHDLVGEFGGNDVLDFGVLAVVADVGGLLLTAVADAVEIAPQTVVGAPSAVWTDMKTAAPEPGPPSQTRP